VEFTITCPIDGSIEVGLEDIETIVLRDTDHADMTFVCPHCGTAITVGAVVPSFLLSAMRALAEDTSEESVVVLDEDDEFLTISCKNEDDAKTDAYCEYFRRQLDHIVWVEDALAEIDATS